MLRKKPTTRDLLEEREAKAIHDQKLAAFSVTAITEITDEKEMADMFGPHFLPLDNTKTGRVIKVSHTDATRFGIVVFDPDVAQQKMTAVEIHQLFYIALDHFSFCNSFSWSKELNPTMTRCDLEASEHFFTDSKKNFKGLYLHISHDKKSNHLSLQFRFRDTSSYVQTSFVTSYPATYDNKKPIAIEEKYYDPKKIKLDEKLLTPATTATKATIEAWHANTLKFIRAYDNIVKKCCNDFELLESLLLTNPNFSKQLKPSDLHQIISTLWTGSFFPFGIKGDKEDIEKLRQMAEIILTATDQALALKYELDHWLNMAMKDSTIMRRLFANKGIGCEVEIATFRMVFERGSPELITAMLDGFPQERFSYIALGLRDLIDKPSDKSDAVKRHPNYQRYLKEKDLPRTHNFGAHSIWSTPANAAAGDSKHERPAPSTAASPSQ